MMGWCVKMNGCRMKVIKRCEKVMMGWCVKMMGWCVKVKGAGGKVCEDDQMVLKLKGWCVGVGNDRV